jgi:hypothetical protein
MEKKRYYASFMVFTIYEMEFFRSHLFLVLDIDAFIIIHLFFNGLYIGAFNQQSIRINERLMGKK